MIKIKIIGGLGNQMFQYAAAKSLAVKNKTQVSADVSLFQSYNVHPLRLNKLSLNCEFDFKRKVKYRLLDMPYLGRIFSKVSPMFNLYIEKGLTYDKNFFSLESDVALSGYFQSEKYFLGIRELLIKEFSLSENLKPYEVTIEQEILESNSISIHIRRGDYISNQSANNVHGTCENDYFIKALSYMKDHNLLSSMTTLFIFSDDIAWCQENLNFDYKTVFVEGSSDRPEVDIHLMSKCEHQIISNSTFSWWGAWLNTNPDKCVVAPQQWFKTLHDSTDIVPQQWKRL